MPFLSWLTQEVPLTRSRVNTTEVEDATELQKEALGEMASARKSLDEALKELASLRQDAQDIMAEDDLEEPGDGK
jgi:GTP1/Obg family GTP-binding protein